MSNMRTSEYVERNDAYIEAEKKSGMKKDDFYQVVKKRAMEVPFPELKSLGQGSLMHASVGKWERVTNGQAPIYSTYKGYVSWLGTADQLLAEVR